MALARRHRQGVAWVLSCLLWLNGEGGAAEQGLEPVLTPQASWQGPPQALRRGQITIAHTPAGPQLSVSRLGLPRDTPPLAAPPLRAEPPLVVRGPRRLPSAPLHWLWETLPAATAGAYFLPPAGASLRRQQEAGSGPVWHFQAQPDPQAPSGLWLRLYDPALYSGLDSRDAAALGFWVRTAPGAALSLRLADSDAEAREAALTLGPLSDYYLGAPVAGWQAVRVPLPTAGLDRARLAQLVLAAEGSAPVTLALRGLALLGPQAQGMPPEPPGVARPSAPGRAVWIWDSERDVLDAAQRTATLDTLVAEGISHVFVQLTGQAGVPVLPGEIRFAPARWEPVLRAAHLRGLRVYALDGDPRYAEPAWHEGVLATQRHLLAYNRSRPPEARFAGLQYDIEPYLLPGYFGARQQALQTGLLTLVSRLAQERQRPEARAGDFELGLAVPFWLDFPDEWSGKRPVLSHAGQTRLLGDHLLARVDHLALMNYRTRSQGPGGLLANAEDLLQRASAQGKQLWIGLETLPLPAEDHYAFAGAPQPGWPQRREQPQLALVVQDQRWELYFLAADSVTSLPESARSRPVWHWPLRAAGHTDPQALSFAGLGRARLEQEISTLQQHLGAVSAYQGVVLHDLAGLRALTPAPERP